MINFTIPGKPYAKKRPRFSRKHGRAFDPAENASFESTVAAIALPHFPTPLVGPVSILIRAFFAPPQTWSAKRRAAALGQPHTQRPDTDNVAKAIMDGLNRIAWADDAQVHFISAAKSWGESDETKVSIEGVSHGRIGQ